MRINVLLPTVYFHRVLNDEEVSIKLTKDVKIKEGTIIYLKKNEENKIKVERTVPLEEMEELND